MNFGFIRVAAVAPKLKVANIDYNIKEIVRLIDKLSDEGCHVICFPEMCITGYSCADLFFNVSFLEEAEYGFIKIREKTAKNGIITITGMPKLVNGKLLNMAMICANINHYSISKTYLPNRNEFYEERWFTSSSESNEDNKNTIFAVNESCNFGVEICEDLWAPIPPSSQLAINGANLLLNPSASNSLIGKSEYRRELVKQQSARTISAYVYASAGPNESTTDVVYSGHLIIAENGTILQEQSKPSFNSTFIIADIDPEKLNTERMKNSSFAKSKSSNYYKENFSSIYTENNSDLHRFINPTPFVPSDSKELDSRCEEIIMIQAMGLAKRLKHTGIYYVVLGLSGGLDSTHAVLVCVETMKLLGYSNDHIIALSLPGVGTSERTRNNSFKLADALGLTFKEISIKESVTQHLKDIDHTSTEDITFENASARERTQILFDMANKCSGIVVGTGDMSELALGWCTFNGDQMSNYGVNSGVPKTLIKFIVSWYCTQTNKETSLILRSIIETPISPELIAPDKEGNISQVTEDIIGPYELHDFFLFNFIRNGYSPKKILFLAIIAFEEYSNIEIKKWLKVFLERFFSNQFKRSCMPDGPKIGSIALSPRGDWRMSSDTNVSFWLNDLS